MVRMRDTYFVSALAAIAADIVRPQIRRRVARVGSADMVIAQLVYVENNPYRNHRLTPTVAVFLNNAIIRSPKMYTGRNQF